MEMVKNGIVKVILELILYLHFTKERLKMENLKVEEDWFLLVAASMKETFKKMYLRGKEIIHNIYLTFKKLYLLEILKMEKLMGLEKRITQLITHHT